MGGYSERQDSASLVFIWLVTYKNMHEDHARSVLNASGGRCRTKDACAREICKVGGGRTERDDHWSASRHKQKQRRGARECTKFCVWCKTTVDEEYEKES